jgi:hypothetical protein
LVYTIIEVVASAYGVHVCCVAINLLSLDPLFDSRSNPSKKKEKKVGMGNKPSVFKCMDCKTSMGKNYGWF